VQKLLINLCQKISRIKTGIMQEGNETNIVPMVIDVTKDFYSYI